MLLLLVAALYQPAWQGGLLWDDPAHITRPGLRSLSGLWRIWTELGATQQYYPLLHSVFWLEHRLWGNQVEMRTLTYTLWLDKPMEDPAAFNGVLLEFLASVGSSSAHVKRTNE